MGASCALKNPKGLRSLILVDPYLSTPIWMVDARKLLKLLPQKTQKVIAQFKKDKRFTKNYKIAATKFYQKFVRRYKKAPSVVLKSRAGKNDEIYQYMWGPEEFIVSGSLKDFDLTPNLHKIKIPVLLISGRFDEATPEALSYFKNLLPNSQVKVFEKSAHFPHLTEKEEYLKTVEGFLSK